ncbi:family 43 glycosylhydrolase [Bacteroidota bacterium]
MKTGKITTNNFIPSLLILIGFIFFFSGIYAQNPIVPAGVYIADPSAHVWEDGKLYVYGSRDESPDYYCSWDHHVISTSDMINWEIIEYAFSSKGKNDQVPYSDKILYAPDCQYYKGTYYLYYCLASNEYTEGVATSKLPSGPFLNGKNIDLGGINQIDPAVFIDDDGQGYYIWGQFTAKMARLKPNMIEIDKSTIRDNIVTEKEHFFHEGGYMVKRNGIYYFIYAHMGRANRPTCIGYSTSDSPMGPYTYGGVIVDNDHSDPEAWNNHGSIAEFNNQWYVFYHRPTHGSVTMRKACVEPIYFNEDGSINEVEMTTQGAGKPLSALSRIDVERACLLFGNVRIQAFDVDKEELGGIRNDDKAAYKYIDFGEGASIFNVRVLPGEKPGKVDITTGQPWRQSISTVDVPGNGDGKTWVTLSGEVKDISGIQAVWLRFYGEGEDMFRVDWFSFDK